jgi:methylated-DNA-[protein]-cysteine S-methyltransferase
MHFEMDTQIGVATCQTALGWVGVAWSAKGLVAVTLPHSTETEALARLPIATSVHPSEPSGLEVASFLEKLRRYYRGGKVEFKEPLDPSIGTGFQKRVWRITRSIPRGQTRTYGSIAREAGSPGAARAVGQAMAQNPWPPIVPCHRVVGHDGRLTGFGGGLEMKRQMLKFEGQAEEETRQE